MFYDLFVALGPHFALPANKKHMQSTIRGRSRRKATKPPKTSATQREDAQRSQTTANHLGTVAPTKPHPGPAKETQGLSKTQKKHEIQKPKAAQKNNNNKTPQPAKT